jgi:hypothetical protein
MKSPLRFAALLIVATLPTSAAEFPTLKPLLTIPDQVVLQEDYAAAKPLAKGTYVPRQGTRWTIAEGVLRGIPSSAEFQAKKKDHFGYEPRISIPKCPQEFAIQFDVRFLGGQPTAIAPFIEFGHHIARIAWAGSAGAKVLADTESVQVAAAPTFKIESGKWYRALAEIKGDELVVQFANGPTLYGKHASFTGKKDGFGVAGPKGGTVELDNVTVWSVKPELQPAWANTRAGLPKPEAIVVKKAPEKKKKA